MLNPIALGLILLGAILLTVGVFWTVRRSKAVGVVISIVGVSAAAIPFLVSLFLAD